MKPERWREVERLFYSALERSPDERAEFLAKASDGNLELQKDVESLLACNEEAENIELLKSEPDATRRQSAGAKISDFISAASFEPTNLPVLGWDRYEFVKFLGKGGMGT